MTAEQRRTVAEYRARLSSDPRWATRAIVVLYQHQTSREQAGMHTDELNGVGFTKIDAEILSSFAQQIERGRSLSERQLAVAFRRLPKYAGQLLSYSRA